MKTTEGEIERRTQYAIQELESDKRFDTSALDLWSFAPKLRKLLERLPGKTALNDADMGMVRGYLLALAELSEIDRDDDLERTSSRPSPKIHDPGTEYDHMQWEIAVLKTVKESHFGNELRAFRQRHLGGAVLPIHETLPWIKRHAESTARPSPDQESIEIEPYRLISDVTLPNEQPVLVSRDSPIGVLWQLSRLFADHMSCGLDQASDFCLCGIVPPLGHAVRIDHAPGDGNWQDALWFNSTVEATPILIRMMWWVSPDRVKQMIRKYQAESWIGLHTPGGKESLARVIALLRTQLETAQTVPDEETNWDQVYERLKRDFPAYAEGVPRNRIKDLCLRSLDRLSFSPRERKIQAQFNNYDIAPKQCWTLRFLNTKTGKERTQQFEEFPGERRGDLYALPVYSEKHPSVCRKDETCTNAHLERHSDAIQAYNQAGPVLRQRLAPKLKIKYEAFCRSEASKPASDRIPNDIVESEVVEPLRRWNIIE